MIFFGNSEGFSTCQLATPISAPPLIFYGYVIAVVNRRVCISENETVTRVSLENPSAIRRFNATSETANVLLKHQIC